MFLLDIYFSKLKKRYIHKRRKQKRLLYNSNKFNSTTSYQQQQQYQQQRKKKQEMSWRALLSHNLQEIRIHFCQSAQSSEGLRNFVVKNYSDIKKLNPKLPFLIREAHGIEPVIYARYDWGKEEKKVVTNLTEQEVEEKLKELCLLGNKMDKSPESELDEPDIVTSYQKPILTYRTVF
ncbi:hypothetical protein DLAC_11745 [Tieghemostelium lacteum]|uniref:Ribosomal protein/NADH dehydrogenase domain-containing protein n=1 Tax=Tieghemostelium lacteum TaxID=361077 RepID=A0A151Z8C2_TIELA|nr:hypothetical protein DLAC_11745 [Tieghemostelium lacteum]|eukprot:KYQ90185.1 hypothetical protein DLAC_11745 [Tieghemostelium lacteum]